MLLGLRASRLRLHQSGDFGLGLSAAHDGEAVRSAGSLSRVEGEKCHECLNRMLEPHSTSPRHHDAGNEGR